MSALLGDFIARWENSGAAECANYQLFLTELCDLLGAPHPQPATPDTSRNAYVFERAVTFQHGDGSTSQGRIDLYKRGCFVLEAKQGTQSPEVEGEDEPVSEAVRELMRKLRKGIGRRDTKTWDDAMLRARGQAEQYARALPHEEGRPPFLVVVDVGHSIELFSEFSCTGGAYIPFPAPGTHRILLPDLEREDVRERLKTVWTEPATLDPTRRSARVTREIAERLARLAMSLEKAGHEPHAAAGFLMRCLFTMFAEDVGLLLKGGFTHLVESLSDTPEHFVPMVEELWDRMNRGGFSTSLRTNILQFNGGLFEDAKALPLTRDQLLLLVEASQSDWRDVEPAIFGTLLERALDPIERHKLGAHYTPRAYVERLVMPTVINPIRAEWEAVHTAAAVLANAGGVKKAAAEVKKFHRKLVGIRVLDPACGTGNFLYVTLEHLKRIEGEVFDFLDTLGERQTVLEMAGETVDPHQFLGLEVNPRAAAIAELVLWIGTLQWHFRNRGSVRPPQPIIRNFRNIECRDALIAYAAAEPLLDAAGNPVTHWDGRTTKLHPVTGKAVPDETARIPVMHYLKPRPAEWPSADYVVGNPPFIGPARMRDALGDGYTEAVRAAHDDVGESSDFVMYWWNHAAQLVREGKLRRFGFVTTNSLRQKFNRRVLESHLNPEVGGRRSEVRSRQDKTVRPPTADLCPLSLLFAIPDHPWVDTAEGAAVRIAMTVAGAGDHPGLLQQVTAERETDGASYDVDLSARTGKILPDLTIGADVAGALPLRANEGLSSEGVKPHGMGFVTTREEARRLGLGADSSLSKVIRPYRNGRDLAGTSRDSLIIDLCDHSEEDVRLRWPNVYQWILERVKPERDQNNRDTYRNLWWVFGEPRRTFRPALASLSHYIVTVKTSKHRWFTFLESEVIPDSKLIAIAVDDAACIGVLSSRIHQCWVDANQSLLEDRPSYVVTDCFCRFPFPAATPEQAARVRALAEQLDAHRKARQAAHPELTMTGMYNVLEKLRSGEKLTAKEKTIHEQGLVSVLKQLHDELDAAVREAYGWTDKPDDEQILERLVALNKVRAAEEARGKIRWLRPEFQDREGTREQTEMKVEDGDVKKGRKSSVERQAASIERREWPGSLPEQVQAVRAALQGLGTPSDAATVARRFARARTDKVQSILETLVTVGQARLTADGKFTAGT